MTISQIISRIYRLTNTNSTSYAAADILDDINIAYNRVVSQIITTDGRWQFDDANNTDFPIATTALVSGQDDYAITSSFLKINDVEIKNSAGTWQKLYPIDQKDISDTGESLTYFQGITGFPQWYDKLGNSVMLYPTPNYSQAASLKVWFERGPAEFTSGEVSTGTKQPGFNSLYHDLIPLWVGYDYWVINDPTMTARILTKIQLLESQLLLDYGARDKDDRGRITTRDIIFM